MTCSFLCAAPTCELLQWRDLGIPSGVPRGVRE